MKLLKSEPGGDIKDAPRMPGGVIAGGLRRVGAIFSQPLSAISDQGFFALGNFAVSTILAREMSKEAFGQFSSAFAAFLLLSTIYCAFVVDPMLVYGVTTASDRQRSYVRNVVALHWRVALILGVCLVAIGFIRAETGAGAGSFVAYIGWAFATPAVLRLWLARRTTYLIRKPQLAALGGAVYALLVVALLFILGSFFSASVVWACAIIGTSSLMIGLLLHRATPLGDSASFTGSERGIFGAHWSFGKWASIAGVLGLLPDYIYFFVLSPERCGEYRALLNVVIPLIQAYNALGVLLMSYFARNRKREDFTRIVLKTAGAYAGCAIVFAAMAVGFGGKVFGYLYGGKYDLRFSLLLPLAIVSVLFAIKTISDALLRSLESVTTMAGLSVVGAVAALAVGVPMALRMGVAGAAYGDLLVYCIVMVAVAIVWIRRYRRTRTRGTSPETRRGLGSISYPDTTVPEPSFQSFTES